MTLAYASRTGALIMPKVTSSTFRDQTTGRINDLLEDEDRACAKSQNLLGYFAGALLGYKDEGVEFVPQIVLCDDIGGLLRSFPGSMSYEIGKEFFDPLSGPKVLKDCAPLSNNNWFIYVQRMAQQDIKYGIFTYARLPTAIPLHEAISLDADQFCVLIRKVAPNTIELRGAKGNISTLIFSTVREAVDTGTPIREFADDCCSGLRDAYWFGDFKGYFTRLLEAALTSSHGTMLVCTKSDCDLAAIQEMKDAVQVVPLLDFGTAFSNYQSVTSADNVLFLQRAEELLYGFMNCDGIIAFDDLARVTAYRVFFKPTESTKSEERKVVGGARRRAFEGVKSLVGEQLISVLFRSQDGLTLRYGVGR